MSDNVKHPASHWTPTGCSEEARQRMAKNAETIYGNAGCRVIAQDAENVVAFIEAFDAWAFRQMAGLPEDDAEWAAMIRARRAVQTVPWK